MKSYSREIVFGAAMAIIFAGLLFWIANTQPQGWLAIGIAIITFLLGIVALFRQAFSKNKNLALGVPDEDEFTKLAKVYAGNRAFLYSMYLWLLIFIFNSSFPKAETMLGIGILGSALIYGISLWFFNTTGEFNEN